MSKPTGNLQDKGQLPIWNFSELTACKEKITKLQFEWNGDGTVKTIKFLTDTYLIFTLSFKWSCGSLIEIKRT